MKISPRSTLFCLFALSLTGCGGESDADDPLSNRFRGSYSGEFQSSSGQNGTFDLQISPSGTVNATILGLGPTGATGTLTGNVTSGGVVDGSLTYENPDANADVAGTFQRDSNGRITGTLALTNEGGTVTLTIDVTPSRSPRSG